MKDWTKKNMYWTLNRLGYLYTNMETLGTLRSDDSNENVTRAKGLITKTTILHVRRTFWYISLPSLHDFDVKMPNFTLYMQRKYTSDDEISSLFLNLVMVLWNSNFGGFAYISQSKWRGVIAIKIEKTSIHFFSDIFSAVAVFGS